MAGLLLFVRTAEGQKPVELSPDSKVRDILTELGCDGRLSFQGAVLDPSAPLCDTGVSAQAVVDLDDLFRPRWMEHHSSWRLEDEGKVAVKHGEDGTWGVRGPPLQGGVTRWSFKVTFREQGASPLHVLLGICGPSWTPEDRHQDPCDRGQSWTLFTREGNLQHGTERVHWSLRNVKEHDVVTCELHIDPRDGGSAPFRLYFSLNGDKAAEHHTGRSELPLYPFAEVYSCVGTAIEIMS
eukprot:TRINITY_DN1594_c0_g1_i1.p1 TRINITY_DN1594_c0_g1~~TRINITY_DN1594_c0_g1_i1.p1  ORF type:complete len:258 (+),score=58.91 TRINITY_DN1594_c0_g1_i1:58-774(+)